MPLKKSRYTVIHILKIWSFILATHPQSKLRICRIMETLVLPSLITQDVPEQEGAIYYRLKHSDMMGTKARARTTKIGLEQPVSRKER